MREIAAAELEALGLPADTAESLSNSVSELVRRLRSGSARPEHIWAELRGLLTRDSAWRWNVRVHVRLFDAAFEGQSPEEGPRPAWRPDRATMENANVPHLSRELGLRTYADLHRWSVQNREAFWTEVLRRLGIVFRTAPARILDAASDPKAPGWLPGARLNIAESCFLADPSKTAIVSLRSTCR